MNFIQIEVLKDKVSDFINSQNDLNNHFDGRIDLLQEEGNYVITVYGENLKRCISGTGPTVDLIYQDFLRSWRDLKGFAWLENKKSNVF